MPAKQEVSSFIRSTFRSVWSLELLCFLSKHQDRAWRRAELVVAMRSSDLVVSQSTDALIAAGLLVQEASDTIRYCPVNEQVGLLAAAAEEMYAQRPDAVRRMIVAAASSSVSQFADAFRLRRD
ncbi:hypothetical protein [Sphingomonas xinjiangensis]|uniref:Uncharacterized protein n=1 Tax=Sphingomonas xinjiangensis TaxID=643568 RepID=A0A840YQK7_9SPHN|nr:hypothetical protein [Sphingomonas xinjiangensis]MBB5711052.1 hypothetical protein [Sphingomonas xinjiangensis]